MFRVLLCICSRLGVSEFLVTSPSPEFASMEGRTFEASDFVVAFDLTEPIELTDSASTESAEVQVVTAEATEPTDTDSYASESSETCEPTECYASEPTEGYEQCKWQGEANVWKRKLRKIRSSINLVETPSPTENCKGNENCKGAPKVLGGWIEPPEKKRVVGAYKYVETPGKSDVRGRPARDVRQWVRVACESAEVRGYWGV